MRKNARNRVQERRLYFFDCRGRQRETFLTDYAQLLARGNRQRQISANSAFRTCAFRQKVLQVVQGSPCQVQYDHNRQIPCHRLVLLAANALSQNGVRSRRGRLENHNARQKRNVFASEIRLPYGTCDNPSSTIFAR